MASKRSDFFGLWFMPEDTHGVDPGIVSAVTSGNIVDGSTEQVKFMPQASISYGGSGLTPLAAFARMAEKPSGLPKVPIVEVPQVFQTNDYDGALVEGLKSDSELTITLPVHGTVKDVGSQLNSGRPVAPPWLHLASSGSAEILGMLAAHSGGVEEAVVSGTATDAFTVTTGKLADGHVVGVDTGHNGAIELIRPTTTTGGTAVVDASYGGNVLGLSAVPSASNTVYYSTQVSFDNRLEDAGPTFTLLLQRPEVDAALIFTGARCKSFELNSKFGEVPTIKLTFLYEQWSEYSSGNPDFWTAVPTMLEEPDYYASWPCSPVIKNSKFVYLDSTGSVVRDLDIAEVSITWESGLVRYMADTGPEGVGAILSGEKSSMRFSFTCLYNSDWRNFIASCQSSSVESSFPFYYWNGSEQGKVWFFVQPSAKLIEDPGFDGEQDGQMTQKITLGMGKYTGDSGSFAVGSTADTKNALGVI